MPEDAFDDNANLFAPFDLGDQLMALFHDITRHEVDYAFDAYDFHADHVGFFAGMDHPRNDAAVGEIIKSAISATNVMAGGGAAGYLALLDVLMVAFRADYFHADDLVARHVLHRPAAGADRLP